LVKPAEEHDVLPAYSDDLINFLDRMYPHECIKSGESLESAHRRAGARELIDFLISWREDTHDAEREAGREADEDPN
jgi:hypothetical protein